MAEERRGNITGYVGDIPIADPYYSGDLTSMTVRQLQAKLNELRTADPGDEDSDEAFVARIKEMDAIKDELKRKQN